MKIIYRIFYSKKKLWDAVHTLIGMHQWFQVTPLPNDEWEIGVKQENERLLNHL